MNALQNEIDGNFDSFQRLVQQYLPARKGEWALLRHGEIIEFYPSASVAEGNGMARYKDDMFSIQEVTDEVVDLGFFSHVIA
ncbi:MULTISPECIES: hypothetical protein [unclassified Sphingomonas]|uniref:hypothetical protein n=1 Tax=unclassified Sphingomonas TaxID=196159 RepID=UPI00226AE559|nr:MULTISPECIES: hypothetical protein [unclassified Sphingomonas]